MEWFVPEWLVAFSLTLFVADIFLMTEILSWGGVFSLATWLTWRIDAPLKWSVLVFVASFTLFAFLYVFLLRTTVGSMVRKLMQGSAPDETIHAMVGKAGVIRIIDNQHFVFVDGELWPLASGAQHHINGDTVKIIAIKNGEVSVATK